MSSYFQVNDKTKLSPFQNTLAYLGGSAIQTIGDNPVTTYRQLIQQFAKDSQGNIISPKESVRQVNRVFMNNPLSASLSGLYPRMTGVLVKRIPKFGFLLGYDFISGGKGEPGFVAATTASILSAPFINPVRMIEKQQRIELKKNGKEKSFFEIIKESREQNYKPLFRGTIPLMGHSFISAILGLVGQPQLQKYIQKQIDNTSNFSRSTSNLLSSAIVSPIYVILTNPLSRLEVIMQTNNINYKSIGISQAIKEMMYDMKKFGLQGIFRGQGVGIAKAIVSLTLFHEGRLFIQDAFIYNNSK